MASGPEHYREAERLLGSADEHRAIALADEAAGEHARQRLAQAAWDLQHATVHAQLAMAAATADTGYAPNSNVRPQAWMHATASSFPGGN
jgi:hypothetical protein